MNNKITNYLIRSHAQSDCEVKAAMLNRSMRTGDLQQLVLCAGTKSIAVFSNLTIFKNIEYRVLLLRQLFSNNNLLIN